MRHPRGRCLQCSVPRHRRASGRHPRLASSRPLRHASSCCRRHRGRGRRSRWCHRRLRLRHPAGMPLCFLSAVSSAPLEVRACGCKLLRPLLLCCCRLLVAAAAHQKSSCHPPTPAPVCAPLPAPPRCAGFLSAGCSCAEARQGWDGQQPWAAWHERQEHRRRSIILAPRSASTGQLWRAAVIGGGPPAPGATAILENAGRAGCGGYAAAATASCAGERVELCSSPRASTVRWVLRVGPLPNTFFLESAANWNCPRRWLGAPAACGADGVGLYALGDPRALALWALAPATP